jgi:hypothetical protein
MKVTPDIERLFRLTIEKHILSVDGLKTTVAYGGVFPTCSNSIIRS